MSARSAATMRAITELTVMVRPLSAALALADAMKAQLTACDAGAE